MTQTVSAVILRVRDIVNQYRDWFEAVAEWYDRAKWTKRIFLDSLGARNRPIGIVTLSVNDLMADERFQGRNAEDTLPLWWLPARLFKPGENLLLLRLKPTGSAPVAFDAVTVSHAPALSEQTTHNVHLRPQATGQASVAMCLGSGYLPGVDRWQVQTEPNQVRFSLQFDTGVPPHFLMGLAVKLPTFGYALVLEDLWDLVEDVVRDKIKDLLKDYFRRLLENDPRVKILEQDLRDLESYLELHHTHLGRMLAMSDQTTLAQVIESSRKPKPPDRPSIPDQPATPPKSPPAESWTQPDRPLPKPKQPAKSFGCGTFVVLLLALSLTAGTLLFTTWYVGMWTPNQLPGLAELLEPTRRKPPNGLKKPEPAGRVQPNPQEQQELAQRLQDRKAQTGDIQVSLFWFNKNDLDLEVVGPAGKIDFTTKNRLVGGGQFDFDMNVVYANASNRPVENIYWARGAPVKGHYKVYVNHFNNHRQADCQDPTRFRVRVLVQGNEQWFGGELTHKDAPPNDENRNRVLVHQFDFP